MLSSFTFVGVRMASVEGRHYVFLVSSMVMVFWMARLKGRTSFISKEVHALFFDMTRGCCFL